jgi:hypothetical protein
MSVYEWERGEFKLPAAEYRNLKKAIVDAANRHAEVAFEATIIFYEKLPPKLRKNFGYREYDDYMNMLDVKDRKKYRDIDTAYKELIELDSVDDAFEAILKSPRKPTKKNFPMFATTRTKEFSTGEAILKFDEGNTIYWVVPENNHAVDHARKSWLGRAFFLNLDRVAWTTQTGGEIWGGDEYSREAAEEDPYYSYPNVKTRYGKHAKKFKDDMRRGRW